MFLVFFSWIAVPFHLYAITHISVDLRFLNICMYFALVYDGAVGVKHGRLYWLAIYRLLRTKGGLMKVVRNTILDMYGGNEPVSVKRKVPVRRRK